MKKIDFNFEELVEKYFKKYSYNINKIVGVDSADLDNLYALENGILSHIQKKDVKEEHLISTYLPNSGVINYEFTLQKNLLEKVEIEDLVETKCYEDVGLDEAEEYIFNFKVKNILTVSNDDGSTKIDDKNVLVEVVIVAQSYLEELYGPIKKDFGYLDFITYSGYVFKVLYIEKILEPQNDLFIYFTKTEVYITLYSEGEFLQTSIIPEGLENVYDILKETLKIKDFSFDKFMEMLVVKGLNSNNYTEKEQIIFNELSELFSNKFLIISNQLHSVTRKFSLTTIDRIYMATSKGVMPGVSEFANMYLGVESNDLIFDTNYNPNKIEIDQMLFLSMLYAKSAYKRDIQDDNLTIYRRSPTFFYRKSGQFITISIVSALLSLVYPLYQIVNTNIVEKNNIELSTQLSQLKGVYSKIKKENDKLSKKMKQKKEEKKDLISYEKNRKKILDELYREKMGYIPKSEIIAILTKYLYENRVYLKDLSFGVVNKTKGGCSVGYINTKQCWLDDNGALFEGKKSKGSSGKGGGSFVIKNGIVLNIKAKSNKNITKFINNLVEKEHMIVYTSGYKLIDDFYNSKIIIKVER